MDSKAIRELKAHKDKLTQQQYRTIKGQILSGNVDAAMKGLSRILKHTERP